MISEKELKATNAVDRVSELLPKCQSFKIGKTGDGLNNRLSKYNGEFEEIKDVYKGTKTEVDDMESILIDKFSVHPKCKNKKDGAASNNDPVAEDAEEYQVYVVYNKLKK